MKEEHPAEEQEKKKERIKVQTKDHTRKCRTLNGGVLREKTQNLAPKPITNSMKQVVQGDDPKTWKDTQA
jgi:hypothetical protein